MRAIEVNEDSTEAADVVSQSFAHGAQQKRQRAGLLLGSFIFGTLIVGVGCGYWVTLQDSSLDKANAKCRSESEADVRSSLEAGLDVVMQWFPGEATLIHQHKNDIIHYIETVEDPPRNSPLQKLKLVPRRTRRGAPENGASVLARRLLHLPSPTCMWALSNFLSNVVFTLAMVAPMGLGEAAEFRTALHSFMEETYDALQVEHMAEQMRNFAAAKGAQKKAAVVVQLLKTALKGSGGWLKFMMFWLADKGKHPWKTMRSIVTLTASLLGFSRDSPYSKLGSMVPLALKIMSADILLKGAREARHACKELFNVSADESAA